jgi:hypothetical protein
MKMLNQKIFKGYQHFRLIIFNAGAEGYPAPPQY